MQKDLIFKRFEDVEKSSVLLRAAVDKYRPYDLDHVYTPDELEYYDSLSFRFEKCVELILNFFRTLELFLYAKAADTLRDRLLVIQKLGLIDDIEFWMDARLLRNKIAHAYLPEEIQDIYQEIHNNAKIIFVSMERAAKYLASV